MSGKAKDDQGNTLGVIVFAAASILKDTVNRIGHLLDDGQPNSSFMG